MNAYKIYRRSIKVETRAHYVVIGFFTVIIFSGMLLFSLWLNKANSNNDFHYYDIVFNESVNGLSKGSPVQYMGIQVGEVMSLNLDTENLSKVWARVRINASVPIKQDTQAVLATRGITGSSYIQLSKGSLNSADLQSTEEHVAVIIATPSALSKIIDHGEGLMTNINNAISQLNKVLSEDNIAHFNNTLKNIDQITSTVSAHNNDINEILFNLTEASRQIKEITVTVNQQGSQLFTKTNSLLTAIEKSNALVSSLLKNNYGSINNGLQSLNRIEPILNDLHSTLRRLNNITRKLEENPTNFLLEREKREEYIPK